jgi:hypothetical protein
MAEFGGPLPSSSVATTTQARGLFRGTSATGVYADAISRFTGGLAVTNGGSLNATVAAGQASVAGLYYENDASKALTLSAADVDDARIDVIVVRLNPASTGTLALAVLEGTPDPSPVAVAVTEAEDGIYELAIAEVVVPAGSAVLGTITDVRVFTTRGNTITALDDTPSTLTGQGGKTLIVNDGGTAVEFVTQTDRAVFAGFSDQTSVFSTNTQLRRELVGGQSALSIPMTRPGSIVGIAVITVLARTSGSLSFEVFKNGSATGMVCLIDASFPAVSVAVQDAGLDTFVASDLIDIRATDSASHAPNTQVSAYFEVQYS